MWDSKNSKKNKNVFLLSTFENRRYKATWARRQKHWQVCLPFLWSQPPCLLVVPLLQTVLHSAFVQLQPTPNPFHQWTMNEQWTMNPQQQQQLEKLLKKVNNWPQALALDWMYLEIAKCWSNQQAAGIWFEKEEQGQRAPSWNRLVPFLQIVKV